MNQKIADAFERLAGVISNMAEEFRDGDGGVGHEVDFDEAPKVDLGDLTPDSNVEVNIADLWRAVNGARYMVRMAREGKIPTMDQRAPLNRALKALKADVPALRKGGIGRLIRG